MIFISGYAEDAFRGGESASADVALPAQALQPQRAHPAGEGHARGLTPRPSRCASAPAQRSEEVRQRPPDLCPRGAAHDHPDVPCPRASIGARLGSAAERPRQRRRRDRCRSRRRRSAPAPRPARDRRGPPRKRHCARRRRLRICQPRAGPAPPRPASAPRRPASPRARRSAAPPAPFGIEPRELLELQRRLHRVDQREERLEDDDRHHPEGAPRPSSRPLGMPAPSARISARSRPRIARGRGEVPGRADGHQCRESSGPAPRARRRACRPCSSR